MKSNLFFSFMVCAFCMLYMKSLSTSRSQRFSSTFSSSSLHFSYYYRSLVHFQLIFVEGRRKRFRFFFGGGVCVCMSTVPVPFVKQTTLPSTDLPLHSVAKRVQNSISHCGLIHFYIIYHVSLIYMPPLTPISHCFDFCSCTVSNNTWVKDKKIKRN